MRDLALKKIYSGKVRDLYEIDSKRMLMVATDRLSAFDVIMPEPIKDKGSILTQISNFWFQQLAHIMPNHLTGDQLTDLLSVDQAKSVEQRAVIVKKLTPLKIEAIVRGYLVGSAWGDYKENQSVCGVVLPKGLRQAQKLPEILFTPSSKAAVGEHDENINLTQCGELIGTELTQIVQEKAIQLYREAAEFAEQKGIIIADTKFEFGLDQHGVLTLMDEVLTPDSSRFWAADQYQLDINPPSFDKQFIRDWLIQTGWNKQEPAPSIPADIISRTRAKYQEVLNLLTGTVI